MAYTAAAILPGPWHSGLPRRLDALIAAVLTVQIREQTGPRVPRLRRRAIPQRSRSTEPSVAVRAAQLAGTALSAEAEPYPVELRIVAPTTAGGHGLPVQPSDRRPAEPEPEDELTVDLSVVPDGGDTHDLIRQAQGGDAEAFGQLYDRYVDLVHRYVYYRVGSQALAEDLTSETFLRALRRISTYTWQGVDIGAWFVTIARNLVADHYKSGRYRLEVQVHEVRDDRTLDGPEDAVIDALDHRVLLEAVARLGAEQQECIVLRFLQGLSVSETALVMGKNDGAVKALQYRAVRSLSRLLPAGFVR